MFKKGFAHSTVNCYISGLSFKNKLHNFEDNTDAFIVRKMLDGIKRCSLNKSDSRLPITRELLGKILSVLPAICKSSFESCLFKSAFSLCYHGMLRVSELTCKKKWFYEPCNFKVTNVRNCDDGLEIFLQKSKTDQYGTGVTIHLAPQGDKQLCPVQALNVYLKFRPKIDGILFCHFDGRPLTKYQFSSMLKRSLSVLGMSLSKLSSHSFRIGMTTRVQWMDIQVSIL
jgi:hypothetical protein